MRFEKTLPLRDGRTLRIRNAEPADAQTLLELIVLTHSQTDYLLAYPDTRSAIGRNLASASTKPSGAWALERL